MPICVAICSTSLSRWLETKTVTPYSPGRRRISSRISWIPAGSRPLVGSSRISSGGRPIRAMASPRRCTMPSEYVAAGRSAASSSADHRQRLADLRLRPVAQAADHLQVLAAREVRVDGRGLHQRPDARQDRGAVLVQGPARTGRRARRWGGSAPTACGWWSSCRRRWGPESRRCSPAARAGRRPPRRRACQSGGSGHTSRSGWLTYDAHSFHHAWPQCSRGVSHAYRGIVAVLSQTQPGDQ